MSLSDQPQSPRRKANGRRFAAAGLVVAASLLALAPAAHAQEQAAATTGEAVSDPLEGFNRASFKFSMGVDKALIGPIAHGYMAVTPKVVRDRVSSAVYNLGEPNTFMNNVLQGKPKRAARTTASVVMSNFL